MILGWGGVEAMCTVFSFEEIKKKIAKVCATYSRIVTYYGFSQCLAQ